MRVAVLGGGLQGACIAMELASAGIGIDLYDKNERCVSRASAQNEGKIHLGYVYANDPTLHTARTMVKGAASFAPLMRRWIGGSKLETVPVSTPFYYAVHRESILSVAEIENHLKAVHSFAVEESRGDAPDYFGSDYRELPFRLTKNECESLFDNRTVIAAFKTPEISIDPEALAARVRERLSADSKIRCLLNANVCGVRQDEKGVTVEFEISENRASERYDHVVNTLWDGRLAVDKTAGIEPERPWLYRVKHYLRLRSTDFAQTIPSVTIVLGAFGDSVTYGDGGVYLSWYPAAMIGSSSELSPPSAWSQTLNESDSIKIRHAIFRGLSEIVPAIGELNEKAVETSEVKGGIIFAWGKTDICDRASGLHERYSIGPRTQGKYHTVDTGKLTMAPLFGKMVADRIRQIG